MTPLSNKRYGVVWVVLALLIITGIAVIVLSYSGNLRGVSITPSQLTAESGAFDIGQQVKVLSGYATSVVLYPLAAGETQKDVLFCNLKPDGSPAYEPGAYQARMDKNAKCLSGYMEATKLREQRGIIQGNLGTVESLLAALSMTGKELASAADYGFSVVVIPSGTFEPTPVKYASGIQMKCVVSVATGGKSPTGIGTIQNLNASTFKLATPASVAEFNAMGTRVARLLKRLQDAMADTNWITRTATIVLIIKDAIALQAAAVDSGIILTPAAAQKYYRSILASGPLANVSAGFFHDEGGKRIKGNCGAEYKGAIGIGAQGQEISFNDVCLNNIIFTKVISMVTTQSQRFFKMRTSLEQQLATNATALQTLENNNYNCN